MSSNSNSKKERKNIKVLFSIVCLCIIGLGLIVYFSTNSTDKNNVVNEQTTLVETTQANRAVTAKETTEKKTTSSKTTAKSQTTTKKESVSMQAGKNNVPYKSYYKYPLGETVLEPYSEELVYNETLKDYRAHAAIDFSGSEGDKVVSINDGIVTAVYSDNFYGMVVEIDHGAKLTAKYCGLDSVSVKKGSYVNIGNTIGTLGKIPVESSSKTHLHFETMLDGKNVNPLAVMSKEE